MRITFPILSIIIAIFIPSLLQAQTSLVPLSETGSSHPNAAPPTKAPEEILPAAPLPDEKTSSSEQGPAPVANEPRTADSFGENAVLPIILISAIVFLFAGTGWFVLRRRRDIP